MSSRPAAIYARVSTDEQAEHGTSLDVQIAECESHAARVGATSVDRYVDAGVSGTLLERPALARLRADAAAGRFRLVVCYDPDRLSRNLGHLLLLVDELRRLGVALEFTNFAMTPTADGRLLFAMRGAIAEFETHKIRQRMTAGKLARAREGRPVGGGHTIYGYAYDKGQRRFVVDAAEAAVVAHIFLLAEEHGTHAIAARLNAAGIPAKQGGRWSQTSVYGILRNPTYLGRMPQMGGAGHVELPVLVGADVFERAALTLARRRNRAHGPARHPYLLSGRLRCGLCGRRMGGGYGRLRAGAYHTRYACSGKRSSPPCPSAYYPSDLIDAAVWRHVAGRLLAADLSGLLAARMDACLPRSSLVAAPTAARRLERQRERLLCAYRNGLLEAATLSEQLARLAAASALSDATPASSPDARTAASVVATVLDCAGTAASLDDRRFVLDGLGLVVTLGPGALARLDFAAGPP